ncbi:universal stress protein [Pricia sp.]|uniref:universal stress protein n=1 Tax=Pricia sp. TaxID=2268138 RepID=UPI0035948D48
MGKKLLLPTDFSKNSWNAIVYALKLHAEQDCDFYILNTYVKDSHGLNNINRLDPDEAFNKLSENRSKEGLGDILNRLTFAKENPNHRFHVLSRSSVFIDAVKNIVENMQIDMIILGAKGMKHRQEGKYGKNTLAVIENVRKCPVLMVPKNAIFNRPEEIVLATNFNTDFRTSEVKYLAEIAKMTGASIQVLSLADNGTLTSQQKNNKIRLQKYFKAVDLSFNVLHDVNMSAALSCFVEIRHSNMVSYIDEKPSFWEKLGFGTPSLGKLGYFKDVPVLALHG